MKLDFSIITPSYNYYAFIHEMLESVLGQTGITYEHLIYDAGSTDGTIEIIKRYDHVTLVVEPDGGMSEAINKGFRNAKGEWVMWLNSDDRLKPGALAAVKEFAENKKDADVIFGAWDFIDGAGHYQRTMPVFPLNKLMLAHYGCYIGSTAAFIRRETLLQGDFYLNERFGYVMDGELYCRMANKGKKFIHYPVVLADFRMHGDNISQKHYQAQGIDQILTHELAIAESRAIRRQYGITLFKNDHLNNVVDAVLYFGFRGYKLMLKLLHKPVAIRNN